MDTLSKFYQELTQISHGNHDLTIEEARKVVKLLNEFLYCINPTETSRVEALGQIWKYISDFHKYWEENHEEILDCIVDEVKCEEVAEALHNVYILTDGKAFTQIYDKCGLTNEQVCQIRMLTANQDFRGARVFSELAAIYKDDPSSFDPNFIADNPASFINKLELSNLSQSDKRNTYAENIAKFILSHGCTPYELIGQYDNNIYNFRNALINCVSAGYGNKKADMLVRDMYVLGIWTDINNFDKIDVASDVNTIKVALRTGILKTAIPLVSSFLDIFCHQYAYIDKMNAIAWRKVWEIWTAKYPSESLESPCLMDYFVYRVVGRQFCKENLYMYECENGHRFAWHSPRNSKCQVCFAEEHKHVLAELKLRLMPCSSDEGEIAILQTEYVKSLPKDKKLKQCPFKEICNENKKLMPPKSISILGQTGWTTAYTEIGIGGGGLMA